MIANIRGMSETIVNLALVLLFVNIITFVRSWSFNSMSTKGILKFLLKMNIYIILSGVFFMIIFNIQSIAAYFFQ